MRIDHKILVYMKFLLILAFSLFKINCMENLDSESLPESYYENDSILQMLLSSGSCCTSPNRSVCQDKGEEELISLESNKDNIGKDIILKNKINSDLIISVQYESDQRQNMPDISVEYLLKKNDKVNISIELFDAIGSVNPILTESFSLKNIAADYSGSFSSQSSILKKIVDYKVNLPIATIESYFKNNKILNFELSKSLNDNIKFNIIPQVSNEVSDDDLSQWCLVSSGD